MERVYYTGMLVGFGLFFTFFIRTQIIYKIKSGTQVVCIVPSSEPTTNFMDLPRLPEQSRDVQSHPKKFQNHSDSFRTVSRFLDSSKMFCTVQWFSLNVCFTPAVLNILYPRTAHKV